jgi:hypothetical protein
MNIMDLCDITPCNFADANQSLERIYRIQFQDRGLKMEASSSSKTFVRNRHSRRPQLWYRNCVSVSAGILSCRTSTDMRSVLYRSIARWLHPVFHCSQSLVQWDRQTSVYLPQDFYLQHFDFPMLLPQATITVAPQCITGANATLNLPRGNAVNLYSGGACFESRYGHRLP